MKSLLAVIATAGLSGCAGLALTGPGLTLASQGVDPVVANAELIGIKAAVEIATADCGTVPEKPACEPVPSTITPQQAQAAVQACAVTAAGYIAVKTLQRRVCPLAGAPGQK